MSRNGENLQDQIVGSLEESASLKIRAARELAGEIEGAILLVVETLRAGGKVLLMGNGGSAADAQHIAAELVGRFEKERRGFAALALTTDTSILTAVANDFRYEEVFARQVEALGCPGDLVIALSTSGNSPNVLEAVKAAKERGIKTIGLAGKEGGKLAREADLAIVVPSHNTARIQEVHITVGHIICAGVDALLGPDSERR